MRTVLISLSALLMTTAAYADPKVGDDVVYNAKLTQGNQSATATVERKLVSYNANTNTFDQQTTVTEVGQGPQTTDDNVDAADLLTDAQINDMVQNCAKYGGASNTVTVGAGKYKTCDVPFSDSSQKGTASVGAVVFGEVKQVATQSDGTTVTLELQSQVHGK